LQTKSVKQFTGAGYTADDLRKIADFLRAVADTKNKGGEDDQTNYQARNGASRVASHDAESVAE
jgi:hypothetical protein